MALGAAIRRTTGFFGSGSAFEGSPECPVGRLVGGGMRNRASWAGVQWILFASLLIAPIAESASLEDVIPDLYGGDGIALATSGTAAFPQFTAPANNELNSLSNAISSGLNLFGSGTAVASFEFDPAQAIFVRSEDSLGPLVGERADTIGKGKLNFGMTYTKIDYKRFNGTKLNDFDVVFPHLDGCSTPPIGSPNPADCPGGIPSPGDPAQELDNIVANLNIKLEQQIFSMFLNYGITDNWEVGIVVPLVDTRIEVKSTAAVQRNFGGSLISNRFCTSPTLAGNPFPLFPDTAAECDGIRRDSAGNPTLDPNGQLIVVPRDVVTSRSKGQAFGIGDILLRTKWNPYEGDGWIPDLAVLGRIRVPSGKKEDFLGTGEANFSAFAVASIKQGWFSPHVNLGVDISTSKFFNNLSWLAGADFRLHERVTLVSDFLGRFAFEKEVIGRNLVDISLGAKINVIGTLNLLANTIVPINRSVGLRPDVTWVVGWEATF